MKQFNLMEYLANPSRKMVTRDGRNVTIHCTNYQGFFPVIAEIEGLNTSMAFSISGVYGHVQDSVYDLFFATEKHEGYACVHFNEGIYYLDDTIYSSKEEALLESKKWGDFVATVKVEWEE